MWTDLSYRNSILAPVDLCNPVNLRPSRRPCGSQRTQGHDPAENHPVGLRGVPQRPLHHPAGDQGQVLLHLGIQQVALQQDSEREL